MKVTMVQRKKKKKKKKKKKTLRDEIRENYQEVGLLQSSKARELLNEEGSE